MVEQSVDGSEHDAEVALQELHAALLIQLGRPDEARAVLDGVSRSRQAPEQRAESHVSQSMAAGGANPSTKGLYFRYRVKEKLASSHHWWALAVVCLAQLIVVIDASVINIALPTAQADIGFRGADRQWVITAYSLAFGSILLLGGRVSDLVGRRNAFIIGLVGVGVASAIGGGSEWFGLLVTARALQGAFGALLASSALAVLMATFDVPRERARAFGIFGGISGLGGAIGLLLGGYLTQDVGWRWNLYINVLVAAIAIVGTILFVSRAPSRNVGPKLDIPGALLFTGGLITLTFGFSGPDIGSLTSPLRWAYLAGSVTLFAAFVVWQRRAAQPLIPLYVVLDRDRGAAYLSIFIAGASMFGVFLLLSYYLQTTLRLTPIFAGLAFLPMIGALVLFAQLATNIFLRRFGPKLLVPIGMGLGLGAMLLLSRLTVDSNYASGVLPPLLLLGAAIGTIVPTSIQTAMLRADRRDYGVAGAVVNTSQQVGGSIGATLLNSLATVASAGYLAAHLPSTTLDRAEALVTGTTTAFAWGAIFFASGLVVSMLMFRHRGAIGWSPAARSQLATQADVASTSRLFR